MTERTIEEEVIHAADIRLGFASDRSDAVGLVAVARLRVVSEERREGELDSVRRRPSDGELLLAN